MHELQLEGGPPPSDGATGLRPGRRLLAHGHEGQPEDCAQAVDSALHPVAGSRVPVQRRQLPLAVLPEDEASRVAHQDLQTQDERRLSHLQATHRPLLLPRQALFRRKQVSGALLSQHQAEAQDAGVATTGAAGAATTTSCGRDEQPNESDSGSGTPTHGQFCGCRGRRSR